MHRPKLRDAYASSYIFSLLLIYKMCMCSAAEENCSSFINTYQDRIMGTPIVASPVSGVSLKHCTVLEKTCCTTEVEERLTEMGKNDFEKTTRKILHNLSRSFKSKSSKFNEYFKDLLTKSKKDFHEMFKKTYGIVYEQNSYVFSDFFKELENYFSHGRSNLADVMDTFFNILYQKMFTVMNSQFKFEDKYMGCVSEHMNELKPFGDVPQKLSLPLKRSFVAARTFAQALNVIGDIVVNLISAIPPENCYSGLVKMLHCSSCNGLQNVKICNNMCLNIMKGCLAYHTEMDVEWNSFVEALNKVQQRLLGPFNIEHVVEPINVKISDAIMNFQESHTQISNKIFNGCGKPPLLDTKKRRKRQANNFSKSFHFPEPNGRGSNGRAGRRKNEKNEPNSNAEHGHGRNEKGRRKGQKENDYDLDTSPIDGFLKFIKEIGTQVMTTRSFWKRLPYYVCSNETNVERAKNASCWNGSRMGNYDIAVVNDGIKYQISNPEVPVDGKKLPSAVSEQISALKMVTSQLKNAYNGLDVEFIDSEETFDAGSGSGFPPDSESTDDTESNVEGSGDDESTSVSKTETSSVINESDTFTRGGFNTTTSSSTQTASTTSTPDDGAGTTPRSISSTTVVDVFGVNTNKTSGGSSIRYQKMSLNTAIASYLLPAAVIWIGGAFNDWFHTAISRN